MKITKAQFIYLKKCKEDGSLIAGGRDQTRFRDRGFRANVPFTLYKKGLLYFTGAGSIISYEYKLTEAGEAILAEDKE